MTWFRPSSWTDDLEHRNYLVYYRAAFSFSVLPGEYTLTLSADSRYKLFVNGTFVHFGPCKGDASCWFKDTIDIASYLVPGENIISIETLCVSDDSQDSNHSLFTAGLHTLFAVSPDEWHWRCHILRKCLFPAEETRFAPLHIHEQMTADPATAGWQTSGFDDSSWDTVIPCPDELVPDHMKPEKLLARPLPFAARTLHHFSLPVHDVPAHSESTFVLDAGEEMTAFLSLSMHGGQGARIELLESEAYYQPDGQKQNRTDSIHGHLEGYTDTYTAGGFRDEHYLPFWFRTFRYIQVTIRTKDEPLYLDSFDYDETGYPLEVKTTVMTSDATLGPVWDISVRTLHRCMHDTYMDCPFYEQLPYIMDTRLQALFTYAIAADDRLARQAIDDFSRSQRPDGLLNACYPNKNENVIPGFSIFFIQMLHDHMMYFGDREFLSRYMPTVDRILAFFDAHLTEEGYVGKIGGTIQEGGYWSFIDWADPWMPFTGMPDAGAAGPITMESLLYIFGLELAAEIYSYTQNPVSATGYLQKAESIKKALRTFCMNDEGMLTDGPGAPQISQHAQVFGILTGTLSAQEGKRNLLRTMNNPSIAQCTVSMCFYLFRALEATSLYNLTDSCWNVWRTMVEQGCTTCIESDSNPRSECHAWGALALYELPSVILGVRPGAPGYSRILVSPVCSTMTSACGVVHTPLGDVSVNWNREKSPSPTVECAPELQQLLDVHPLLL